MGQALRARQLVAHPRKIGNILQKTVMFALTEFQLTSHFWIRVHKFLCTSPALNHYSRYVNNYSNRPTRSYLLCTKASNSSCMQTTNLARCQLPNWESPQLCMRFQYFLKQHPPLSSALCDPPSNMSKSNPSSGLIFGLWANQMKLEN